MRVIRAAKYSRRTWKNGGGFTHEIAANPIGANMDDFNWRLSMAEVASNGPFSKFPGVDRTLFIVRGEGMKLAINDRHAKVKLGGEPARFSGEDSAQATLVNGPIVDLNIMCRQGRFTATAEYVKIDAALEIHAADHAQLLFSINANIEINGVNLAPFDTIVLDRRENLSLPIINGIAVLIGFHPYDS